MSDLQSEQSAINATTDNMSVANKNNHIYQQNFVSTDSAPESTQQNSIQIVIDCEIKNVPNKQIFQKFQPDVKANLLKNQDSKQSTSPFKLNVKPHSYYIGRSKTPYDKQSHQHMDTSAKTFYKPEDGNQNFKNINVPYQYKTLTTALTQVADPHKNLGNTNKLVMNYNVGNKWYPSLTDSTAGDDISKNLQIKLSRGNMTKTSNGSRHLNTGQPLQQRNKFLEQLQHEQFLVKEMSAVRNVHSIYEHLPIRVNPRSKVNLYKNTNLSKEHRLVKSSVRKATVSMSDLKHCYIKTSTMNADFTGRNNIPVGYWEADQSYKDQHKSQMQMNKAYNCRSAEDFREDLFRMTKSSLDSLNKRYTEQQDKKAGAQLEKVKKTLARNTALTRSVAEDQRLKKEKFARKVQEAKTDPLTMLSPRAYTQILLAQPQITEPCNTQEDEAQVYRNMQAIMMKNKNLPISEGHQRQVMQSLERGNVASTHYFQQDLAFKMIKITDLNHECWNLTDTVQAAYGFLLDEEPDFKVPSGIRVSLNMKESQNLQNRSFVRKPTTTVFEGGRKLSTKLIPTHLAHLKLQENK